MSKICFVLESSENISNEVYIRFQGADTKMTKYHRKDLIDHFDYEASFGYAEGGRYPRRVIYSFSIDNYMPRYFILNDPPQSNLVIPCKSNFDLEFSQFINVFFFYLKPMQKINGGYILSNSNCFYIEKKWTNRIQLKFYNEYMWGNACINKDNNYTISYKYVINSPQPVYETTRAHNLILKNQIGGKAIIVYDFPSVNLPIFSFYFNPICTDMDNVNRTRFILEHIPHVPTQQLKIDSGYGQKPEKNSSEFVFPDVSFIYSKEFENMSKDFNFQIAYMAKGSPDYQSNEYTYKFYPIVGNRASIISARPNFGAMLNRSFGVYIPIISLKLNDNRYIGDFESLSTFLGWCKRCGLSHVHVHLNKVNNFLLIDPIQISIDIPRPEKMSLECIRNEKVKALFEQYTNNFENEKPSFDEFCRLNEEWLGSLCTDSFERFVQYKCYSQLSKVFARAVEIGVQIILDVVMTRDPKDTVNQIGVFSRYSQCLKITNTIVELSSLPIERIQHVLGDHSSHAMDKLFIINGNEGVLRQQFYNPNEIKSMFKIANIDGIIKLLYDEIQQYNDGNRKNLYLYLQNCAKEITSTIIMDSFASVVYTPRALLQISIVPCLPGFQQNSIFEPNMLSPEMISSFPYDYNLQKVKEGLRISNYGFTFHLRDFILMFSGIEIQGIQIISDPGFQSFVYTVTSESLRADEKISNSIIKTFQDMKFET